MTFTKERLTELSRRENVGAILGEEIAELARIALASLEAEPVAFINGAREPVMYGEHIGIPIGTHLYTAPPAPVVQPMMFIDGDISSEDADKLAKVIREFNEEDERPLAKMARMIRENPHPTNECDMPKAQPAPVVPDEIQKLKDGRGFKYVKAGVHYSVNYANGWNQCRAAMLQGADGNSPAIPDGYALVPIDMAPQMMRAVQLNSELGAYAAAELAGAYSLFREFWGVAIAAAPQQEVK